VSDLIKAIKYKNLDEARSILEQSLDSPPANDIFDDNGEEPQGLLSVIPEDRLSEEQFYQLFGIKKGVLIEVEKIEYSGYGPPADEQDYLGFISEECAYVTKGCRLDIEIDGCPNGARDIHHLEAMVMDAEHPLNRWDLIERLKLNQDWDFDDLFDLIIQGEISAQEIDEMIHKGIQ
jgi:hypothetical protein